MTMSMFNHFNRRPVLPLSFPIKPEHKPDPNIHKDFESLIKEAISTRSQLGLTTEVFAECINATYTLRYYFQEPTEHELASIGLYRQGYWLRARRGAEHYLVSIPRIAAILHTAQVRR